MGRPKKAKNNSKIVTISLDVELIEDVRTLAEYFTRDLTKQIRFLCVEFVSKNRKTLKAIRGAGNKNGERLQG